MPETDILSIIAKHVEKLANSRNPAAYIMLAPETLKSLVGCYLQLNIRINWMGTETIIGLKVIQHPAIRPDGWLLLDRHGRPQNTNLSQDRNEAGK